MAHIPRLFVPSALSEGTLFDLDDGQARYLTKVMRLPDGASVRAFNGCDGEWACKLAVTGRKAALVPARQTREQTPAGELTLLFAPLKKTRTDFVIEKACELGVSAIQPVITEYTQTQRVRPDRLQALAIEAAEQTERMDVPDIRDAVPLGSALSEWSASRPLVYCDEAAHAQPAAEALRGASPVPRGVLIGPEGGFSAREQSLLRELAHVIPVTLGPRILRAETAAISILTLWQSELGDWANAPYLPQTD